MPRQEIEAESAADPAGGPRRWPGTMREGTGGAAAPKLRSESRIERRVDAVVHLFGLALGLVGALVLAALAAARADALELASLAVYLGGLIAMLGFSALYNIKGGGRRYGLLRRLDHAAIFVMIAGTYTPFSVLLIGDRRGLALIAVVWAIAAVGTALKLLRPERIEAVSVALYLLLGWTILIAADRLVAAAPPLILGLLVAGGIVYSIGVVF